MQRSTARKSFVVSIRHVERRVHSYRSAILADFTLSMRMIERLFRIHFWVRFKPMIEPGDFSISIRRGPVACLTLSVTEQNARTTVASIDLCCSSYQQWPHRIQWGIMLCHGIVSSDCKHLVMLLRPHWYHWSQELDRQFSLFPLWIAVNGMSIDRPICSFLCSYLSAGPCGRIFVIISGLVLTLSSEAPPRKIKP